MKVLSRCHTGSILREPCSKAFLVMEICVIWGLPLRLKVIIWTVGLRFIWVGFAHAGFLGRSGRIF